MTEAAARSRPSIPSDPSEAPDELVPNFPVIPTQGDQSSPFFSRIIARLADAVDSAAVSSLPGAGHVPHTTHP